MGRLEKSQWGHNINNELKYTYEKEYDEKPVEEIQILLFAFVFFLLSFLRILFRMYILVRSINRLCSYNNAILISVNTFS